MPMRTFTCLANTLVCSLTCLAVRAALAQSSAGMLPTHLNSLNNDSRGCAVEGSEPISQLRTLPSRSPAGLLNPRPPRLGAARGTDAGDETPAWSLSACVEAGALLGGNREDASSYRMYRDTGGRAIVNNFWLGAENQARFVEAFGGGLDRSDQYYGLRLGRANDWALSAFFDQVPHVFTSTFRSLWNGVGSADLTLKPGLVPGGLASETATQAALRGVLSGAAPSTLRIVRERGGVGLEANLSDSWRGFVSYRAERRRGARPSGAAFGGLDLSINVQVPESIDALTHDLSAGVSYVDALNSLNLALAASLYRNRIGTQTFDNPLAIATNSPTGVSVNAFTRGRFDLDPDNDYTSAKIDYARAVPQWRDARLTATVAVGRMRQNDALIAPTLLALDGATLNAVPISNAWNTTAALTRTSADARIDTRLVTLSFAARPARALAVSARYRRYELDNSTSYLACNPLTGQPGRLLNDGSGAAVVNVPDYLAARCDIAVIRAMAVVPDRGDAPLRSVPAHYTQQTFGMNADWRIGRATNLGVEVEREEFRRRFRERERTWEDKIKVSVSDRSFGPATLRAAFAYGDRRGSDTIDNPYGSFTSAGLGPLPTTGEGGSWIRTVNGLHKFDLADRRRATASVRANVAVTESIDAGLSLSGKSTRYPDSDFGRVGRDELGSVGVDLNVQSASGPSLHGFYTRQTGRLQQIGIQSAGCTIGTSGVTATNFESICARAGGPLFPRDRSWEVRSRDTSDVVGAGLRAEVRRIVVDVDYTFSRGVTSIRYARGAGLLLTPIEAELAGNGWPDLKFRRNALSASALVPLSPRVSTRVLLRLENGRVDDWHYAGVDVNPVPAPNAVYLDAGPDRYRASFVGIFARLAL